MTESKDNLKTSDILDSIDKSNKIYYTMSEVAEMFGVSQPLIRVWIDEFSIIKPSRNKKGNRLFKKRDIEAFGIVYHLIKEKRMTHEGAKLYLANKSLDEVAKECVVVEKLESIKLLLTNVLNSMDSDSEEINQNERVVFVDQNI